MYQLYNEPRLEEIDRERFKAGDSEVFVYRVKDTEFFFFVIKKKSNLESIQSIKIFKLRNPELKDIIKINDMVDMLLRCSKIDVEGFIEELVESQVAADILEYVFFNLNLFT